MTEKSYLWTTNGTGDGASEYTQADWSDILRVVGACHGHEGVAPDYLNKLAATSPSSETVRVQSGAALVDGKPYLNDANKDLTIDAAVGAGNTRIDRIVLRADWSAQTVRLTVIEGTDAASPTAPAITQTSETTYDILLWQALVDTSGNITLTDERAFSRVDENSLATSVAGDLLEGGGGDPLTISNRTRKFFVNAMGGFNETKAMTGGTPEIYWAYIGTSQGIGLPAGDKAYGSTRFLVPSDFSSTLKVSAVIFSQAGSSADIYHNISWKRAPVWSTDIEATTGGVSNTTKTVNSYEKYCVLENTITGAAADDLIEVRYVRNGEHANDTYGDTIILLGFLVKYTADS